MRNGPEGWARPMIAAPQDIDQGQRPFEAVGANLEVLRDTSRILIVHGPAGTGKTRTSLEKLLMYCYAFPGWRGLLVRKTRSSMTETTLRTWEDLVLPRRHHLLSGPDRQNRYVYRFENGSTVMVCGLDKQNVDRIMSGEFDMIVADEALELTEDDVDKLMTRMRAGTAAAAGHRPFHQLLLACNPGPSTHFLRRMMDDGRARGIATRHTDNPRLYRRGRWTVEGRQYMELLERLTGHRRLRLLVGQWASAEGMVYPDWDEAIHVVDPFRIPAAWPRVRSIDFGFVNPFCCQWWAVDPDGRMYLYRELYQTGQTVSVHARRIMALEAAERAAGIRIEGPADHDADGRAELHAAGVYTTPADKALLTGIEAVTERLQEARLFLVADALDGLDEHLHESKLPVCTQAEFPTYEWKPPQPGHNAREEPIDRDNHGLDALRYAVRFVDSMYGRRRRVQGEPSSRGISSGVRDIRSMYSANRQGYRRPGR